MTEPIYYDTETCGLVGPVVLIQYAEGEGEVHLHSVWKEPIHSTMTLIEWMMNHPGGLVGFNLTFDHFQLQKIYNMFERVKNKNRIPEDNINLLAKIEADSRDGSCLKPAKACDLMLVARRGPYQSLMARKPIKIRRVPVAIAQDLANELEQRVKIKDIYFSRRKNKSLPKWEVKEAKDRHGDIDPNFRDVIMDFKASTALKVIANDLLGIDRYGRDRSVYSDISLDRWLYPAELGYAPFATAIANRKSNWRVDRLFPIKNLRKKYAWPGVIEHHISHWHYGTDARQYASDDVNDTRGIYHAFDDPQLGDTDSELACMVGSVRWRGFSIDIPLIEQLKEKALNSSRIAPRSPGQVKDYIYPLMNPMERIGVKSTKKMILEEIVKTWKSDCPDCDGEEDNKCPTCKGTGAITHPVCERVENVLQARKAKKDVEMYDKLLLAGRFHASFVIIGTLSNRMSGADSFNAQAIRNDKKVKSAFTLYHPGTILCGGDYEAFEVSLAEANYNDAKLREELQSFTPCYKVDKKRGPCNGVDPLCEDCHGTNQSRMKIHALFGTMCFPHMTYAEIVKDTIIYTRSKAGFFSQIYGGNFATLMTKMGVDEKSAMAAESRFGASYEGVARARKLIFDKFCSMRQPAGIGSKVIWNEPEDYIENMITPPFRRYFLLENEVCKALFQLSNSPPKHWSEYKKMKTWRRDREQTVNGAAQSALYGAAFQIQAANMRAAANHVIQSTGAEITKDTQLTVWNFQPSGINEWFVMPMNVHDEIEAVIKDDPILIESVKLAVNRTVEKYRPLVPLIGLEWKTHMSSWAEK